MRTVSLEDKYLLDEGRIYLSGIQALVRLPLIQRRRDLAAGLNTAGFISGYRGSPLGGLDEALWKAKDHLEAHHVRFQPGVNEELAATAVWGSQQVALVGDSRYDGVFALWYGKGPGVDRCGDVFKHMNYAGTSPHGGVLLVAGDDHGAYSSTLPHQSDHLFSASMIPVLYPAHVGEYLELGLHGWAMSRFSGCAVAFKALADTVETTASIAVAPDSPAIVLPGDFTPPPGGLHARLSRETLGRQARAQEALMQDYKIYAALAYSRANRLNRVVLDSPRPRLGIVATGKSYLDVREALAELGIDDATASDLGLRLFKVAMPWPLEPDGIREFARGLEEILVVEEKRQLVEYQLKEQLYNWRPDVRPRVIGKFDESGEWVAPRGQWLLPAAGDLSVAQIARVIAERIGRFHSSETMRERLRLLEARDHAMAEAGDTPTRPAWYCGGCPHNRSTKVPGGSVALAGIGCHVMATAIYPEHNRTLSQMGGEGAGWIGQAAFSERQHVFANLGDGTWFHSGQLAIRASVAAGVNITYKLLYNDAVAMTGGQPVDGTVSVAMIAQQAAAEGVRRIAVVAEFPERHAGTLPAHATVHPREDLEAVQRELREVEGVSLLVFDQTCAAEKRRRRRKGEYPVAPAQVVIHPDVCEGCGDCGLQSNCTAIIPVDTPLGRKRAIDADACNQDLSCLQGLCPSLVTVAGVKPRRAAPAAEPADAVPLPAPVALWDGNRSWNVLITGIGGTGVITVGALLGMAAHLEGGTVSVLDMTGMSQKNGAVSSHVRVGTPEGTPGAARIAVGEADLLLGCDLLTVAAPDAIARAHPGRTHAVANVYPQPPGTFAQQPDWTFPEARLRARLGEAASGRAHFVDATAMARGLLGDAVGANVFLLGYAFQLGLLPVGEAALLKAIELNGVAVKANHRAFTWGRRAALDPAGVAALAQPAAKPASEPTLEALVADRMQRLTAYQDRAYARAYQTVVERARQAEARLGGGEALTRAVAHNLHRLMAVKDEYEVARLYTDGSLQRQLQEQFEGAPQVQFHLAPPLLARVGPDGRPRKRAYGSWVLPLMRVLAGLRGLRGSALDPFGRTAERRTDRRLHAEYLQTLQRFLPTLDAHSLPLLLEFAKLPEQIRGFGAVREAHVRDVSARWDALRAELERGPAAPARRDPEQREAA